MPLRVGFVRDTNSKSVYAIVTDKVSLTELQSTFDKDVKSGEEQRVVVNFITQKGDIANVLNGLCMRSTVFAEVLQNLLTRTYNLPKERRIVKPRRNLLP